MYEHILIPTDGSKRAKRATEHGLELASEHGATVHALYVIDTGEMGFAAIPSDITELKDRLRKRGEEVLAEISERADEAAIPCETVIEAGLLHDVILEHIDGHDIDLVVMGKHGYLDSDSHVLGSVTRRVMRHTDVPVQAV